MSEVFNDDPVCFLGNIQTYNEFRKVQQAVNERASEFAELFQSIDKRLLSVRFCEVETYTDSIEVKWYWYGSYGAVEEGTLSIPTEILFAPKETWRYYIIARVVHEIQQEKKHDEDEKEKERQKRIAQAKAVLEQEGAQ